MVRILICDDDAIFAQDLLQRILALPSYYSKSMSAQCLTDLDAMDSSALAQCDILFLDIDLGDQNGIDLARGMRAHNPEAVLIFVTNFSEYAPEGYEVNAFRYLTKADLDQKLPGYFSDALKVCRKRSGKWKSSAKGRASRFRCRRLSMWKAGGTNSACT